MNLQSFGTIGMGIMYPTCYGIVVPGNDCKGIITTSGEYFGIVVPTSD